MLTHTHARAVADCNREGGKGRQFESLLVVGVSFQCSFESMGGLNVTYVRRERIPLLWSAVKMG